MKIVIEKHVFNRSESVLRIVDDNDISYCNIYRNGQIVFPESIDWTKFLEKGLPTETFDMLVKTLKEQKEKNDVAPGN